MVRFLLLNTDVLEDAVKTIGLIIFIIGIGIIIYYSYLIIRWMTAPKVVAVISDIRDETWNDGMVRFKYKFMFEGHEFELWGPWYESFNPIICICPRIRLGKKVTIHLNRSKMKILHSPLFSIILLPIGALIAICGVILWWIV